MSNTISFLLGAVVALGATAFGAHLAKDDSQASQSLEATKVEALAGAINLPVYVSERYPPQAGIVAELMNDEVDPENIAVTIQETAQSRAVIAVVDLLVNDRQGLASILLGDKIYSNECTIIDGRAVGEVVVRPTDKDPIENFSSEKGQHPVAANAQCLRLFERGLFSAT